MGGLDITTTRNIYGRQTESFETQLDLKSEHLANMRNTGIPYTDFMNLIFVNKFSLILEGVCQMKHTISSCNITCLHQKWCTPV